MDRIQNCKTFTCKACRVKQPREKLAATTSQAGLCQDCHGAGKRLYIAWLDQHCYHTLVAASPGEIPHPQRRGEHAVPPLKGGFSDERTSGVVG